MFCPICRSEYEEGVLRCPDHDAELVATLASVEDSRDDSEARFVPLHNHGSPAEAEMVHDILTKNGIRAAVKSSGLDVFSPLLSSGAGAVILVDERDLDRAQEIYASFFGDDTTPLTGSGDADEDED